MNPQPEGKLHAGQLLLALTAAGATALAAGALLLTRPFAEASWSEAPPHPRSIYEQGRDTPGSFSEIPVVSPFHLHSDPMDGLLLANFEGDPDRTYHGLEPQVFDDDVHGRGILVIGWRVDGRVDVFHSPGLRLDPQTYGITGSGLHRMEERSFTRSEFRLRPGGVQVDLAFDDLEGRQIELEIRESDTRPRRPFGLLAPMGSAVTDPPALPLVLLRDFYFVRRAGSEVRIEIDGRPHRGDAIPILLDGARVHFIRYSPDPFIVTWNPTAEQQAEVLDVRPDHVPDRFDARARGVHYVLQANGDHREIRSMSRREGAHEVVVEFEPAFPHLLALRDGADVSGAFRISAHPSVGTVNGTWRAVRRAGEIHLELSPEGGWTPGETPRMARALFRVVSLFRAWPSTYVWRATLPLPADGQVAGRIPMRAVWERLTD